jgi:superfamily II helicase
MPNGKATLGDLDDIDAQVYALKNQQGISEDERKRRLHSLITRRRKIFKNAQIELSVSRK